MITKIHIKEIENLCDKRVLAIIEFMNKLEGIYKNVEEALECF